MTALVTAVSCGATHSFSKREQASIRLIEGLGVEGDAHLGRTARASPAILTSRTCARST